MARLSLAATLCETVVSNTQHRQLDVSFNPAFLMSHTLLLTDYVSVLAYWHTGLRKWSPACLCSGVTDRLLTDLIMAQCQSPRYMS